MQTLANKTIFITGASRGIGKAIALRAARDGANVVIAAKTSKPHPMLPGIERSMCRTPEIVADAAHAILTRPSRECSGNFFIDEQVLAESGVTALDRYTAEPGGRLMTDLFLES